ncbi:MAG: hypothetical protein YHS30scaffold667_46 [Phage 65_10]|nr:MAG: hypothetical protein YHS30scaffold667_46 [Phage 65_10]
MTLAPALAPFNAYRQFILCRLVPSTTRAGKTDKLPCDYRTGAVANAHDPNNWTDAETAYGHAAARGAGWGVAFVLTANDPFWFLDMDECLTPTGWSQIAQLLCASLPGAAIEVSQSGRGLHVFGTGVCPPHGCKNIPLGLELYTEGRLAFLGDQATATGNAGTDCSAYLPALVASYFPPTTAGAERPAEWTTGPCAEWSGPTDDDDLIRRALNSQSARSAFGGSASFRDLFEANVEALARAYPDQNGRPYDASSADMALAAHFAFWTGRDCARIERLMRRSALVREKWDGRDDYLTTRTIMGACGLSRDVMNVPATVPALEAPAGAVETPTFLGVQEQLSHFKGCVYVSELDRVLIPGGQLVNESRFRVLFGGRTFMMDAANERTSRNAWECFTESQVVRPTTADSVCFKPGLEPAALVVDAGRVRVNTFWPVDVPRAVGDATPFQAHMMRLIPDPSDREIAMCYLAACVQHQGTKFQWAPLFQGVEGNGKTLLSTCVANAVGQRYSHWPKASLIAKQFNAWRYGKTFIAVEDIYLPNSQMDVLEELKPMITGEVAAIEAKGVDEAMREMCDNFVFNANSKAAMRKTKNDRRFAVFYTAQQSAADLVRDRVDMASLYDWYKGPGLAIVNELLWSYPIPDRLNPARGLHRAPRTSSTDAAIAQGLGSVEQEVMEAIEQGLTGFMGGWVSSTYLDRLLEQMNLARAVPRARRRDLMTSLGYDWHPALDNGRADNAVLPDGGKPRLYIRDGHPERSIQVRAEVARAYSRAQGVALGVKA